MSRPKRRDDVLTGEEAARRLEAGEVVLFEVEDVMNLIGRAGAEAMLASLQRGELVGYEVNGKRMLQSDDLLEWMAAHPQYPLKGSTSSTLALARLQ